jgi:hypothetical protein
MKLLKDHYVFLVRKMIYKRKHSHLPKENLNSIQTERERQQEITF